MATPTIRANSIRGERRRLLWGEGRFFLRAPISENHSTPLSSNTAPLLTQRDEHLGRSCHKDKFRRTPSIRSSTSEHTPSVHSTEKGQGEGPERQRSGPRPYDHTMDG